MKKFNGIQEMGDFIEENKIAMLYFSSDSCNVCLDLWPKVEKLLECYPEINWGKIEVDKNPIVMGTFNVFTLPCILIYIDGKEIIREARLISINQLEDRLKRYYTMLF